MLVILVVAGTEQYINCTGETCIGARRGNILNLDDAQALAVLQLGLDAKIERLPWLLRLWHKNNPRFNPEGTIPCDLIGAAIYVTS